MTPSEVITRPFDPDAVENGDAFGSGVPAGNALLQLLSPDDLDRLRPHLARTSLDVGEVIAQVGEPIRDVCFLEGGVAGFRDVLSDGRRLAVRMVGREGFVGWPRLMGNDQWPYEVLLRAAPATALKVEAARMDDLVAASPSARDLLLRYAGVFMTQMGRTIVSNVIDPVDRRAARWLLLYHGRLDGDEITMTHEELGSMLGVRRSSATDALHVLEGEGLIHSLRGRVVVRDRAGLGASATATPRPSTTASSPFIRSRGRVARNRVGALVLVSGELSTRRRQPSPAEVALGSEAAARARPHSGLSLAGLNVVFPEPSQRKLVARSGFKGC